MPYNQIIEKNFSRIASVTVGHYLLGLLSAALSDGIHSWSTKEYFELIKY